MASDYFDRTVPRYPIAGFSLSTLADSFPILCTVHDTAMIQEKRRIQVVSSGA